MNILRIINTNVKVEYLSCTMKPQIKKIDPSNDQKTIKNQKNQLKQEIDAKNKIVARIEKEIDKIKTQITKVSQNTSNTINKNANVNKTTTALLHNKIKAQDKETQDQLANELKTKQMELEKEQKELKKAQKELKRLLDELNAISKNLNKNPTITKKIQNTESTKDETRNDIISASNNSLSLSNLNQTIQCTYDASNSKNTKRRNSSIISNSGIKIFEDTKDIDIIHKKLNFNDKSTTSDNENTLNLSLKEKNTSSTNKLEPNQDNKNNITASIIQRFIKKKQKQKQKKINNVQTSNNNTSIISDNNNDNTALKVGTGVSISIIAVKFIRAIKKNINNSQSKKTTIKEKLNNNSREENNKIISA